MPLRKAIEGNSKSRPGAAGRRGTTPSPAVIAKSVDLMCAPKSHIRNQQIFGEGDPTDYLYKIESGCVRIYKTLDNGRRQLITFHLAGDYFGLEGRDRHTVTAEATTLSKIRVIKRKALMANGDMAMMRHLLDLTAEELRRTQNHNLLLLRGAQERVVGFLHDMAGRGDGAGEIELPMSRRDIADYLGLTIETVSRTLTRLEADATISLPSPWRVVLRNPAALN